MLNPGAAAPEFELRGLQGGRWALAEALKEGPVAIVLFKVGCPTCQFTFPFLDRIAKAPRPADGFRITAVSQDDAEGTRQFLDRLSPSVNTLLDGPGYPVSKAFQISHVPSVFLLEKDGKISFSAVGFEKKAIEELGRRAGVKPFLEGEEVPDYRPG